MILTVVHLPNERGGRARNTATLFKRCMLVSIFGCYPAVIICGIPTLIVLRKRVKPTLPLPY